MRASAFWVAEAATSVPHLRGELEPEELLVRVRIADLGAGPQLDVGEVVAEAQAPFELAHVLAVAGEAAEADDPLALDVGGEPEAARVPVRVVDLGRVVAPQLLQLVAIGGRTVPGGEHVSELEER